MNVWLWLGSWTFWLNHLLRETRSLQRMSCIINHVRSKKTVIYLCYLLRSSTMLLRKCFHFIRPCFHLIMTNTMLYCRFEEALRREDSSVSIPYWDSSFDNNMESPLLSVMWDDEHMGNQRTFLLKTWMWKLSLKRSRKFSYAQKKK